MKDNVIGFIGTKFRRIIPDEGPASKNPRKVRRVIYCTGKVYYELVKERNQLKLEDTVAIVRLEQVSTIAAKVFSFMFWSFKYFL